MSELFTHWTTRAARAGMCRPLRAMALVVSGLAVGMPVFAGNLATMTDQNLDRQVIQPADQTRSLRQAPPDCHGVPLDNFVPGQSPLVDFWNALAQALRQRGFSPAEVKKLQEAFGHLDAMALQHMSEGQLLPWLTGRTVAEKLQKLAVVRVTASDVQVCLTALGRAEPRPMDRQVILPADQTRSLQTGSSSLARVGSLTAEHREVLQRSSIDSAAEVANLPVQTIASMLRTSQREAEQIALDARTVQRMLDTKYSQARSLFSARRGDSGDAWSQLIEPDNQCTVLVRKTCSLENQCSNINGCQNAIELLRRFNQGGRDAPMAQDACWTSLSDEIVFPPCGAR